MGCSGVVGVAVSDVSNVLIAVSGRFVGTDLLRGRLCLELMFFHWRHAEGCGTRRTSV